MQGFSIVNSTYVRIEKIGSGGKKLIVKAKHYENGQLDKKRACPEKELEGRVHCVTYWTYPISLYVYLYSMENALKIVGKIFIIKRNNSCCRSQHKIIIKFLLLLFTFLSIFIQSCPPDNNLILFHCQVEEKKSWHSYPLICDI